MKKTKLKKTTINSLVTYGILILAFRITQGMVATGNASRHMKSLLVPICFNIILAVSLNLVIGFLGDLSLGHAGFMSVGAYASCLFSIHFQEIIPTAVRFPLAMLVGGICAAVFGLVVGVPVLRLKGDYLAIVTLAFGEILRSVIINLDFTGGAAGLMGMPKDSTLVYGFAAVMITVIVITNLVNSKAGRAITAIRDNQIAASACGININSYKVMVFVVSAFFAGVAGGLYGHNYSIITAGTFDYNKSIEILVMVVFGGLGSIRGSIIAATLITLLPEMLRGLADYRMLIYAVVLIALMIANQSPKFNRFKKKLSLKNLFGKNKSEEEE